MSTQSESFRKRDKDIATTVQEENERRSKFLKQMKEKTAARKTPKHEIVDLGSGESEEGEDSEEPEVISAGPYCPPAMDCKCEELANGPSSEWKDQVEKSFKLDTLILHAAFLGGIA